MNNGIASLTPSERDINTVLPDSKPVIQTSSLEVYVQLVEPVIFLRGFNLNNRQSYLDSHYVQDGEKPPPALLRGSVVIRILKPTRFKKIDLTLKGTSRVEWPEGLSQLRKEKNLDSQTQKNPKDEYSELYSLLNHNWPFYNYKSVRVSESSGKSNYERILEVTGASTYRPLQSINQFTNTTANGNGLRSAGYAGKRRVSFNDLGFRRGSTSGGLMGNFLRPDQTTTSARRPSFIAELFGTTSGTNSGSGNPNKNTSTNSKTTSVGGTQEQSSSQNIEIPAVQVDSKGAIVFPAGEYVYVFEQLIPHELPETIKTEYGYVTYELILNIRRASFMKAHFLTTVPVKVVRTQSENSLEETEPIIISKEWFSKFKYDIIINSKDVILDAYLPVSIHLTPLDKISIHRIRIYITETVEYYSRDDTIERKTKSKKYLLLEHIGKVKDPKKHVSIKNLGNLLEDEHTGDLVSKMFDFRVFVPQVYKSYKQLHPDTSYDKIVSKHTLKTAFRVSYMVENKRKHFEVSVDSPIRVLHRLCSHANTLLPIYSNNTKLDNTWNANIFHESNIYYPEDILSSPVLSGHPRDVNDINAPSVAQDSRHKSVGSSPFSLSPTSSIGGLDFHDWLEDDEDINAVVITKKVSNLSIDNPQLNSNIYEPRSIPRELALPQAVAYSLPATDEDLRGSPPPPYSVGKYKNNSGAQSQETLIGENIPLNIMPSLNVSPPGYAMEPIDFKLNLKYNNNESISPQMSPADSPYASPLMHEKISGDIVGSPGIIRSRSHDRSSEGGDIIAGGTATTTTLERTETEDGDDENDITMFNIDLDSWYPYPLNG